MSIPKVIHYCWFGRNPLPKDARKCIKSWKKFCPDYQIIQWNEDNFDFTSNRYAREAYEEKKWAFVSDYARLKIIYDQGGIYLDTDVELLRPLDFLLSNDGFLGFQNDGLAATGLGFGAVKRHPIVASLLNDYKEIPFRGKDGIPDSTPCPDRNTATLLKHGLKTDWDSIHQIQDLGHFLVYPPEYFGPKDFYTGSLACTSNTCSIHHYTASWLSSDQKKQLAREYRRERLRRFVGPDTYSHIQKIWSPFKNTYIKLFRKTS